MQNQNLRERISELEEKIIEMDKIMYKTYFIVKTI